MSLSRYELERKIDELKNEIEKIKVPEKKEIKPIKEQKKSKQAGTGTTTFYINQTQVVNVRGSLRGNTRRTLGVATMSDAAKANLATEEGQALITEEKDGDGTRDFSDSITLSPGRYILIVEEEHRHTRGNIEVDYYYRKKEEEQEKKRDLENRIQRKMEEKKELQTELNLYIDEFEERFGESKVEKATIQALPVEPEEPEPDPEIKLTDIVFEHKVEFGVISVLLIIAGLFAYRRF